mmetsp:Transcript_6455/g.26215  ORF Transcript_6455/g.26215 Transcript_6455/m.26215 type:complete len:207 (-) Transcript_6455:772-1392(-)
MARRMEAPRTPTPRWSMLMLSARTLTPMLTARLSAARRSNAVRSQPPPPMLTRVTHPRVPPMQRAAWPRARLRRAPSLCTISCARTPSARRIMRPMRPPPGTWRSRRPCASASTWTPTCRTPWTPTQAPLRSLSTAARRQRARFSVLRLGASNLRPTWSFGVRLGESTRVSPRVRHRSSRSSCASSWSRRSLLVCRATSARASASQ